MHRSIIYQIGRLERSVFDNLNFKIDNREYLTSLTSFAIKEHLEREGHNVDVILLYPASLIFNKNLLNDEKFKKSCPEEFYRYFKYAFENPDEYLKAPAECFKQHPHSKMSSDFLVIHSLGIYNTAKGERVLNGHYSDIVLRILSDMIDRYLSVSQIKHFIIDISSGHNIYITALLEAARYLKVWLRLHGWSKEIPGIEIAISDPIIPGVKNVSHKISFEEIDAKAMFLSPVGYSDIQKNPLSKEIYSSKDEREKKRALHRILERFAIVYSAIKNNTPLIIYQQEFHAKDEAIRITEQLLKDVTHRLTERFDRSAGFNKNIYIKTFLALSFYAGIIDILKQNGVRMLKEGVELWQLRETFKNIYKLFGLSLNDTVLGNEVDSIDKELKNVEHIREWKPLITVLPKYQKNRIAQPNKRNFFAHAGFEGNVTECRVEETPDGKKIYVRYTDRYSQTIEKWLLEALNE
jgi:CRISPR-associated protein Csx1